MKRLSVLLLLLGNVACPILPSCADVEGHAPRSAFGAIEFALIAEGEAGTVYRLRRAEVEFTGPEQRVVSVNGNDTVVRVELEPGSYEATLLDGWQMQRRLPGETFEVVHAALKSPQPQLLTVNEGEVTELVLRFDVGDDAVTFGNGGVDVTLEVNELEHDAGLEPAVCGNGIVEAGEWCDDGNGVDHDGCDTDCSDPLVACADVNPAPSECEAIVQIASGARHGCALSGGQAYCWGQGLEGQIGNGATEVFTPPTLVGGLPSLVEIAAGNAHSCAVASTGEVYCWGWGTDGQLGNGAQANSSVPVQVQGLSDVTSVSAGTYHTCAVRANGRVSCWGRGWYGQLGNGSSLSSDVPVTVVGLTTAVRLAAGAAHNCALTSTGTVHCWGDGIDGQLGNGSFAFQLNAPGQVPGLTGVTRIAAGVSHSCAVANERALCWGSGASGALGDGLMTNSASPVEVANLTGVEDVAAGWDHSCALTLNQRVYCWGDGFRGQLATTDWSGSPVPIEVSSVRGAVGISVGSLSTCSLSECGCREVSCWGYRLGNGTVSDTNVPAVIWAPQN